MPIQYEKALGDFIMYKITKVYIKPGKSSPIEVGDTVIGGAYALVEGEAAPIDPLTEPDYESLLIVNSFGRFIKTSKILNKFIDGKKIFIETETSEYIIEEVQDED